MKRILLKCAALLLVWFLLAMALLRVQAVVQDRIQNRHYAVQSVVSSLAGQQTLIGPVLVQQCTAVRAVVKNGITENVSSSAEHMLLPAHLEHRAQVDMQTLYRSLHRINTYGVTDRVTARFLQVKEWMAGAQEQLAPGETLHCAPQAQLMLALSDPRGIRQAQLRIHGGDYGAPAGRDITLLPGTPLKHYSQGLHAVVTADMLDGPDLQAALDLTLLGTERLSFVPLGRENVVELSGNWPHPAFGGSFLPMQRSVDAAGFSARWELSALASSARQAFEQGQSPCRFSPDDAASYRYRGSMHGEEVPDCLQTQATSFISPVNPYSLSERATKYGLLFVLLTFVAVGLFEVLKNLRVHPVQYLLVGAGLSMFFLLLISLSEHMAFGLAYLGASAACVLLLSYYASHVLGGVRRGAPFAAGIGLLYGFLYVLLQLEQSALLVGSLALFAVLAGIMISTRHVDWYAFSRQEGKF